MSKRKRLVYQNTRLSGQLAEIYKRLDDVRPTDAKLFAATKKSFQEHEQL